SEARISAARITAEAETRAAAILGQAAAAAEERERESVAAREKLQIELAGAHAAVEEQNASTRVELERERERLEHDQEALQELLEGERTRALGEAQEKAATILADARHEVEQLQSYGERLRPLRPANRRPPAAPRRPPARRAASPRHGALRERHRVVEPALDRDSAHAFPGSTGAPSRGHPAPKPPARRCGTRSQLRASSMPPLSRKGRSQWHPGPFG